MTRLARLIPFLLLLICGTATAQGVAITTEVVTDQLDQPVFAASPPGDPRLFVVEQSGRIRIIADGALQDEPFLDISGSISSGGEQGLLGLAFHPDFASNGRFFINYTDLDGHTQIVAYQTEPDATRVTDAQPVPVLTVEQPFSNHNGGWIGFGPDGYLYIGMGDGGSGGDPMGNGQNPNVLLAKILRLDVDGIAPYAIPPENPFADGGGAPEIFATGARNPWRPSFDGNDFYIADVGQGVLEEVTVISVGDAGANLGWNIMEGSACFGAETCDSSGVALPQYEYSHDEGCSITGGYVYRGAAIPELNGHYFFADYCAGFVRSFRYADGAAQDLTDWSEMLGPLGSITSFGLDNANELYITTQEGRLLKIVRAE